MIIEQITIQNFRNVAEAATFRFNPQFTVVIGVNGRGKSTLLHALRVACGSYFLAIPDVFKKGAIAPEDVRKELVNKRLVPKKPVVVEAVGRFPELKEPITWRRRILEDSNTVTSSEAEVGNIRSIGKAKYQEFMAKGGGVPNLPVIAFFGTSRAHGAARNIPSPLGIQTFKDGYHDWFEMRAASFKYKGWLATYDMLLKNGREFKNTREAFQEAILKSNRYIKQLEIDGNALWLQIEVDGSETQMLPIEYHSDGICYYTEMVAELAFRCVVLNGHLEDKAVTESTGVVLIDELDLLLHPTWQRHVVNDLKAAFPKIQFVVTSHSPFIVQSLNSDEIWNLDKDMDITPKDLKIDTIVTEVMGVSSAYSAENEEEFEKKKASFQNSEANDQPNPRPEEAIEEVSDPAIRALLALKNMIQER